MKCFIVITIEDGDAFLATRKRFETREAAREYIQGWADCHQKLAMVVECPHGLEY